MDNQLPFISHLPQATLPLSTRYAAKQVHRFHKTWHGCQQRSSGKLLQYCYATRVLWIVAVKNCDQRTSIAQNHTSNPCERWASAIKFSTACSDCSAKGSARPSMHPTKSPRNSYRVPVGWFSDSGNTITRRRRPWSSAARCWISSQLPSITVRVMPITVQMIPHSSP